MKFGEEFITTIRNAIWSSHAQSCQSRLQVVFFLLFHGNFLFLSCNLFTWNCRASCYFKSNLIEDGAINFIRILGHTRIFHHIESVVNHVALHFCFSHLFVELFQNISDCPNIHIFINSCHYLGWPFQSTHYCLLSLHAWNLHNHRFELARHH